MFQGKERRAVPRHKEARIVKYTLDRGEKRRLYYGVTGNLSAGGCWFYTAQELKSGEQITFQEQKLLPCRSGIVRWTKKIAGIYQVGMECVRLRAV